jgi:secondary thiamine-phosphate synthase enzyme
MVKTYKIKVKTKGDCHVVNVTEDVQSAVADSQVMDGVAVLFNVGSTAGMTTLEYEPGLVKHDMAALFERLAPQNARYEHEETWHDNNGHSHCRAALLGPSLSVPVVDGALTLGTWQQIVLIDFDTSPRDRTIVCQVMGAGQ